MYDIDDLERALETIVAGCEPSSQGSGSRKDRKKMANERFKAVAVWKATNSRVSVRTSNKHCTQAAEINTLTHGEHAKIQEIQFRFTQPKKKKVILGCV